MGYKKVGYTFGGHAHTYPHSWGFLFVGGWVDLDKEL